MRRFLSWIALPLMLAAPAAAQILPPASEAIRPDDAARLEQLDAAAGRALMGALARGDAGDVDVLVRAMAGTPQATAQQVDAMAGDWSCRMLKLGGITPLTVYQPFRCRIGADGRFEKLTGSQRTVGEIRQEGERLVYLGTAFIAGDTPPAYADLPSDVDVTASPQVVPEVGVLQIVSDRAGRMILPLPHLESELNILLLER